MRETHLVEITPDRALALPEISKLDDSTPVIGDILLCALGFEDRCLAAPQKIANKCERKSRNKFTHTLVAKYTTNSSDNLRNEKNLLETIKKVSLNTLLVDADDLTGTAQRLENTIMSTYQNNGSTVNIVIDLSSMSGSLIFALVNASICSKFPTQITALYTSASVYFPTRENWENDSETVLSHGSELGDMCCAFAELGAQDPFVHPSHQGIRHDGRPDFVIAFPSFRSNRLVRCLDAVGEQLIAAPSNNILWVFGQPRRNDEQWRQEVQKGILDCTLKKLGVANEENNKKHQNNKTECCVFDYRYPTQLIISEADKHLENNVTLIPMGSKLQNFGLSLGLAAREEVRIITARPSSFSASAYTQGVGDTWHVQLPDSSEVLRLLRSIGTLEMRTDRGMAQATPFGTTDRANSN